jgi:hypothetical protein
MVILSESRDATSLHGYRVDMDLLLIPLVLAGVFLFPFAMAWLEPKQTQAPTHRGTSRRTGGR